MAVSSACVVTFKNEDQFMDLIKPFSKEEAQNFLKDGFQIEIAYDSKLKEKKIVPLKHDSNLEFATVFKEKDFKVCFPEFPRVPHQLSLVFNKEIHSILDLNTETTLKMYDVIQKITEIYMQQLEIDGYVLAHYLEPCQRHHDQYVVELLPHQPGLKGCRDFLDKADSNRHVLYGDQNYSHVEISFNQKERDLAIEFWKKELGLDQPKLSKDHTIIPLPTERKDSQTEVGKDFCVNQLLEYFENHGAQIENKPLVSHTFKLCEPNRVWQTVSCAFCKESILNKQMVFEYNDVFVLYNFRKMPHEATSFLILPKRHVEQIYNLTNEEIETISFLQKALMLVLKDKFPNFDVILYNQGNLSVGQTVPHAHDQVVALDPKRAPLHWSMLCLAYKLNPTGGVTDEEMQKVTEEFSTLLAQKVQSLKELEDTKKVAI